MIKLRETERENIIYMQKFSHQFKKFCYQNSSKKHQYTNSIIYIFIYIYNHKYKQKILHKFNQISASLSSQTHTNIITTLIPFDWSSKVCNAISIKRTFFHSEFLCILLECCEINYKKIKNKKL